MTNQSKKTPPPKPLDAIVRMYILCFGLHPLVFPTGEKNESLKHNCSDLLTRHTHYIYQQSFHHSSSGSKYIKYVMCGFHYSFVKNNGTSENIHVLAL